MELAEEGDLGSKIRKGSGFNEATAKPLVVQILKALDYIHRDKMVVHRDIKSENILLGEGDVVKVGCPLGQQTLGRSRF